MKLSILRAPAGLALLVAAMTVALVPTGTSRLAAAAPPSSTEGAAGPSDPSTSDPTTSSPVTTDPATTTTVHGGEGGGNPNVLTFIVDWRLADGSVPASLAATLPIGWEAAFALAADGTTGEGAATSADCTYPTGSDTMTCTYSTPGHGGVTTGMVLTAKQSATYSVAVTGIPTGWAVDPSTVGTFLGRSTCPRGSGGSGGHEEAPDGAGGSVGAGVGAGVPCSHTVVVRQSASGGPVTTISVAVAVTSTAVASAAGTGAPASGLPSTGSPATTLVALGASLAMLGTAVRLLTRR